VVYQNLSEADFAAALKSVGLPAGLADSADVGVCQHIGQTRRQADAFQRGGEVGFAEILVDISAKPTSPPR
jgi:hypothetical protein